MVLPFGPQGGSQSGFSGAPEASGGPQPQFNAQGGEVPAGQFGGIPGVGPQPGGFPGQGGGQYVPPGGPQYGAPNPGQGGFAGIGQAPRGERPGGGLGGQDGQLPDNVRPMFENLQGQNQQLALALQQANEKISGFEPYMQQLEGLKQVFAPEQEQQDHDPVPGWQQQLDYYLSQAIEAEKAGRPLPLTTNLAVSHFQSQIENHQRQTELMRTIDELKNQVQAANDPSRALDNQAYANIDTSIMKGLSQFYGDDPTMDRVKGAQFRAVSGLIVDEIKNLRQENPRAWDQVRRDPGAQQRMVNHFLMQYQPPRVRQMIETQRMQDTPMNNEDLVHAFREANQIEDPHTRAKVQTQIRQQILKRAVQGDAGRPEAIARSAQGVPPASYFMNQMQQQQSPQGAPGGVSQAMGA